MGMDTHIGPVVSMSQLAEVESQVAKAVSQGAEVLIGGKRPDASRCPMTEGSYFEPTILKLRGPDNYAFQEEIFGPVITVTPFKDEKEAVSLANNSKYGLGGAVWTMNVARAH